MIKDELRYRALKLLSENPNLSQREIAQELGISLGKLNFCLKALIDVGVVKVKNFKDSRNKKAYAYLLTPKGIEEKGRVTMRFLEQKVQELGQLERDIAELRREVGSQVK